MARLGTTAAGSVNRHDQRVLGPTGRPGTDHGQKVYVLHCERCGHEYGANGSDLWLRRCPACDGGAKGFEVTAADVIEMPEAEAARRNPPWTRDELILALELYLRNPAFPPGKTSREIAELSMVLNSLSEGGEGEHDAAFRNANGVYMKLMNFRRFDPAYQTAGKVGLTRGNRIEGEVWGEFADDVARLQAVAAGIRRAITVAPPVVAAIDLSEIAEAVEGRLLTRLHLYRERDRELVKRRKQRAMWRDNLDERRATIRMRIVSRSGMMIVAARHERKPFNVSERRSG